MRADKIQQKTINCLLDKYERSKTFTGTNQVEQSFEKKIEELFPKYSDDAEYELFCDINHSLRELEQSGLILLKFRRNNVIARVALNSSRIEECYACVERKPKREEYRWLEETMEKFRGCPVLDSYFEMQKIKIAKNQKVEYFDGDRAEYLDLLKLVTELFSNQEEQFVRDFSVRQFHDSKRIEKLASKASALMYQYGDYQDREAVMEECGIVSTPTYVCMKGQAVLRLGAQTIDLSNIKGDIALSTTSMKEVGSIQVKGDRVVTVENLTSFHDYRADDDFVIYLGGFHNKTKRTLLAFLYGQNPEKEYRHFGDIDAGGFYILEHLKEKTGIPFRSMNMDLETLSNYIGQAKKLTGNDRKRIEKLLEKLEERARTNCLEEDYRDVLQFMLDHDCKLEQEAVKNLPFL